MAVPNGLNPEFEGAVRVGAATAVTAAGSTGVGLLLGNTTNFGIFFGSGAPTIQASKGSLYLNTTGSSTSTRLYVNSTGAATWVAVTTAS